MSVLVVTSEFVVFLTTLLTHDRHHFMFASLTKDISSENGTRRPNESASTLVVERDMNGTSMVVNWRRLKKVIPHKFQSAAHQSIGRFI